MGGSELPFGRRWFCVTSSVELNKKGAADEDAPDELAAQAVAGASVGVVFKYSGAANVLALAGAADFPRVLRLGAAPRKMDSRGIAGDSSWCHKSHVHLLNSFRRQHLCLSRLLVPHCKCLCMHEDEEEKTHFGLAVLATGRA